MKTWIRKRGDRVKITSGKYAGQSGTVESNVYQRTVDYPDEFHNGFQIMLDTGELVTVRWEQVEVISRSRRTSNTQRSPRWRLESPPWPHASGRP